MELIEKKECEECEKERKCVGIEYYDNLGVSLVWLCKSCLERALRLINGEDDAG